MTRIATALRLGQQRCAAVGDSPALDAQLLLCAVLCCDRTYLFTWPERSLTAQQQEDYEQYLLRRSAGEPVAHILGQREFWSLPLQVNHSTLIPRPDTELLVSRVLASALPAGPVQLLELGTGTGAISLALASERPQWQLLATDVSPEAVQLARANRDQLGFVQPRIQQSDWFQQLPADRYHGIVSNPPYLAADDPHLQQGDVRFEPHSALVADEDGLADLHHLIDHGRDWLLPGGMVWLEHGAEQGAQVRHIMQQYGYSDVQTWCDLAGLERVTAGRWVAVSE